ncbi:MAG TPA: hypothetical protein VF019_09120, partial [Nitrospira sp.]
KLQAHGFIIAGSAWWALLVAAKAIPSFRSPQGPLAQRLDAGWLGRVAPGPVHPTLCVLA